MSQNLEQAPATVEEALQLEGKSISRRGREVRFKKIPNFFQILTSISSGAKFYGSLCRQEPSLVDKWWV
jgi:hypothetical protein